MLSIITGLLLFLAAAISPNRSALSEFELRRRLDAKQHGSLLEWRRGELHTELMTIRRVTIAFLLVVTSALIIARFGWIWGLAGAFVLTVFYNRIASIPPLHRFAQNQYNTREAGILRWVDRHRKLLAPLRGPADTPVEQRLASRDELLHLVDSADGLLSSDECRMIRGAMSFDDKLIRDHMTPRSVMEAIGVNELLGPLVLDDLHKTGHSHFPVLDGDIDHIVGMLHLHNLLTITQKKSVTVREVMEPRVLFIHEEQSLGDALSACIKHRRHLLVVINEFRETVGVITIEDAVEQLIGRQIVDENDNHDDLRRVAARNPRGNNKPPEGKDVK